MNEYSTVPDKLRRFGAIRGYNKRRRMAADFRRMQLASLCLDHPDWTRQKLAETLGVAAVTVSKDLERLRDELIQTHMKRDELIEALNRRPKRAMTWDEMTASIEEISQRNIEAARQHRVESSNQ